MALIRIRKTWALKELAFQGWTVAPCQRRRKRPEQRASSRMRTNAPVLPFG